MTFIEAAIAVLEREGRPLHFKKLTEIALKENLLTVVGRSPETTMQQRLNDALKKNDPSLPLTREKPGIFGLRYYPARHPSGPTAAPPSEAPATEPGAAEPVADAGVTGAPGPTGERKRRRRRGGRGRGRPEEAGATNAPAEPEASEPSPVEAAPALDEEVAEPVERAEPRPGASVPERKSFAEAAAAVAEAHRRAGIALPAPAPEAAPESSRALEATDSSVLSAHLPPQPAEPIATPAEEEASPPEALEPELPPEDSFLDEDVDQPRGPLIAPAYGTEELVRGEDHRPLVEDGGRERGSRRGRERRRGGESSAARPARSSAQGARQRTAQPAAPAPSSRPAPAARPARPARPARQEASPPPSTPPAARPSEVASPIAADATLRMAGEPRPGAPPAGGPEGAPPLVEAAVEILRACEGRSVHARQIVEMALKRRLLRGDPVELMRLLRIAIVIDLRERESIGLRPRVRPVGGSNYVLADRRLEAELAQQERDIAERAQRLSVATCAALQRRLGSLPVPGFESLMRIVLARLGIEGIELVKRGDDVAYFGGARMHRGGERRVLIALRPGEQPVTRRAVGELRAGMRARSFDEGLMLAAGVAAPDALAEVAASAGAVDLQEGEALAALCVLHRVGVIGRAVRVDILDLELLGEVAEA